MKAVKIPVRQRLMLCAGGPATLRAVARAYLKRWAGQLPEGGVITAAGSLASGACGHYSFWKWRIARHKHPGDRPVPADLQAALRGEAPVPAWFTTREGETKNDGINDG